jgi:hypothetical protein
MIEIARRAAAFLSWYYQSSLSEVRFAFTLHTWTMLFTVKHVFFFLKKKRGRKMQTFIHSFSFSDILCILPDVSVLGALLLLLLYN